MGDQTVGADRFLWPSDYPHSDGIPDPAKVVTYTLRHLPEAVGRKVLGENAVRLYKLG